MKTCAIVFLSLVLSLPAMAGTPAFRKIIYIVFENGNYSDALQQPFFAQLARGGALFTNFLAETHPSQPNYIAMIAGSTLGVRGDRNANLDAKHLGNLLEARGLTWKAYAENLPAPCFLGASSGPYYRKHVPFLSFLNIQASPSECGKIVDGSVFMRDVASGTLPNFSMYTPNIQNDGHNSGVAFASQWFANTFGRLLSDSVFMRDTLFIITFDESENLFGKNQVYTVFYGANVIPGTQVTAPVNHYSVLLFIEDSYHLGSLGTNDVNATQIPSLWK